MISLDSITRRSKEILHEIHKSMMDFQIDDEVRDACKIIRNAYSQVFMTGLSEKQFDIVEDQLQQMWVQNPDSDIWYANGTGFKYQHVNWKKYMKVVRYLLDE